MLSELVSRGLEKGDNWAQWHTRLMNLRMPYSGGGLPIRIPLPLCYKKFLASVIRYTTTIMDPPSHAGLFAVLETSFLVQ